MTVVASISRSFGGLLLGYAAVTEPEIEKGIETLARALEDA